MIKLDMRERLKDLTTDKMSDGSACKYSAPCAIGAMLTPEELQELLATPTKHTLSSDDTTILALTPEGDNEGVSRAAIFEIPADQRSDFDSLQTAYDIEGRDAVEVLLQALKAKYL